MEIKDYKSNSNADREKAEQRKKVSPVVSSAASIKKDGMFVSFMKAFLPGDVTDIKTYLLADVLAPAVKKAISDLVTIGTDMLLFGESGKPKSNTSAASKISYRNYYAGNTTSSDKSFGGASSAVQSYSYDNIIFQSRGDAEAVLDQLIEIINGDYKAATVNDLYDLAGVTNNNFAANNYGWTNLSSSSVERTRDGYILKLPRAKVLD